MSNEAFEARVGGGERRGHPLFAENRASEAGAVDHLIDAARELIGAARSVLDAMEAVIDEQAEARERRPRSRVRRIDLD